MSDVPEELLSSWPPALREEARKGFSGEGAGLWGLAFSCRFGD